MEHCCSIKIFHLSESVILHVDDVVAKVGLGVCEHHMYCSTCASMFRTRQHLSTRQQLSKLIRFRHWYVPDSRVWHQLAKSVLTREVGAN